MQLGAQRAQGSQTGEKVGVGAVKSIYKAREAGFDDSQEGSSEKLWVTIHDMNLKGASALNMWAQSPVLGDKQDKHLLDQLPRGLKPPHSSGTLAIQTPAK